MLRFLLRALAFTIGLYAVTYASVLLWTYLWPIQTPSEQPKSDAIVCLGAGVLGDGRMGILSRQRALTCVDLYQAEVAPLIAFTGDVATPKKPGVKELATQMAQLALDAGVPQSALIIELESGSTLQNALFTLPLLERKTHLTIVTDSFHLPRSWLSFKWAGVDKVSLYPSTKDGKRTPTMARTLRREALAIWFNALRLPVHKAIISFDGTPPNWLLR